MRNQYAALIALFAGGIAAHGGTVLLPADNNACILNGAPCAGGAGHNASSAVSFFLGPDGLAFQGSGTLSEFTTGTVSGAIPTGTSIPFSYDFTLVSEGEGTATPTWELTMEIVDGNIVWSKTFDGTYGSTPTEFLNSGSIATTGPIASGDTISVGFTLSMTNTSGILTVVHIPAESSVDIGPATVSAATPEPSTAALFAGSLAMVILGMRAARFR